MKSFSHILRGWVLSLIFKKDDPLLLENDRPISLLSVDLKLLSYVLFQRLKKIIPKRITGYLQNRFVGFNHSKIQDIIDFSDSYNINEIYNFCRFH